MKEERVHSAVNPAKTEDATNTLRFELDAGLSRFAVQVFAGGLLSAFGHSPVIAIRDFQGEIDYHAQAVEKSIIELRIDANALEVASDVSDRDRREIVRIMRQEVLEVDRYPKIVYHCSRVSASTTGQGQHWAALNGDLTMHGITRNQSVSARVSISGNTLRASGEFIVRQTDYGIRLVSVAGVLKVKDELKLSFDLVARTT